MLIIQTMSGNGTFECHYYLMLIEKLNPTQGVKLLIHF